MYSNVIAVFSASKELLFGGGLKAYEIIHGATMSLTSDRVTVKLSTSF